MKRIAILMTVFNRRETTLRCLRQVAEQQYDHNNYSIDIYLTNDGCTDGTPEAVAKEFPQVNIIEGDGTLFWNRGMYTAWKAAIAAADYDYYMWLNDDTFIYSSTMARLLESSEQHSNSAIIVGSTSAVGDISKITYGGWVNGKLHTDVSKEQMCQTMNGNIVLVPQKVYAVLGTNDPVYRHALGDIDYGLRAQKAGIEVWTIESVAGECNLHSHPTIWKDPTQPFGKRWKNFFSPIGNNPFEFFKFRCRYYGFVPACVTIVSNFVHFLFPKLWNNKNI